MVTERSLKDYFEPKQHLTEEPVPAPVDSTLAWMGDSVNTSSYRQRMLPAPLPQRSRGVQHEAAALWRNQAFPESSLPSFSFSFFVLSLCIKRQWCLLNSRCFLQSGTFKTPARFGRSSSGWGEVVGEISSQLTQMGALGTNLSKCSPEAAQGLPFPTWAPVSTL